MARRDGFDGVKLDKRLYGFRRAGDQRCQCALLHAVVGGPPRLARQKQALANAARDRLSDRHMAMRENIRDIETALAVLMAGGSNHSRQAQMSALLRITDSTRTSS
jgi:hypothetical protein